jgi:hypothetical protein
MEGDFEHLQLAEHSCRPVASGQCYPSSNTWIVCIRNQIIPCSLHQPPGPWQISSERFRCSISRKTHEEASERTSGGTDETQHMIWSSQTKRGTLPHQHSRHIRNITISPSSISITALPLVRPYLVGATSITSRTAQVGNGQHLSVDNEHRTGCHQQTRGRSKACQIDDRTPRHRT